MTESGTAAIGTARGRVLLCGNRSSTRVSGLTVAFDMLVAHYQSNGRPHVIVDKGSIGAPDTVGAFDPVRAVKTVGVVARIWAALPRVATVYDTVAPTRLGFARDACMIWPTRILRRRLVLHLFGGGYGRFYQAQPTWLRRFIRATISQADTIVVEGRLLRDQFDFVRDLDAKLRVVPNGLPADLDPHGVGPKRAPGRDEPVRLLYMSNMIASKGYLDVLDACRRLRSTWDRPFVCDFAGAFVPTAEDDQVVAAHEAERRFHALVADHGLEGVVRHHGVVRGSEKEALLRRAHLFLLPTAYPWEGQPFSIIEALAFATPVLTTNYRGIPELVVDGYNGRYVGHGAPDGLAAAIRDTLATGSDYERLCHNARTHYAQHFTQEAHLDRLVAAIEGA